MTFNVGRIYTYSDLCVWRFDLVVLWFAPSATSIAFLSSFHVPVRGLTPGAQFPFR